MSEWISVTDKKPPVYASVLVSDSDVVGIGMLCQDGLFFCDDSWFLDSEVTHWMPLPEPPVEDGKNG